MVLLLRGLPVLIEIGLLVFCLIEAIQTPGDEVRNLPKFTWILLIVFLPLIGCIAWLVAGRPNSRRMSSWRVGNGFPEYERPAAVPAPPAPDDDPEFLRTWEADLRARESELRREREDKDGREPGAPG